MLEDLIWELVQAIDPGIITYVFCGIMLLLFLVWLSVYQLGILGSIARSLKKMNKILLYSKSHAESIGQIDDMRKNPLLENMWISYYNDYTAGSAAPLTHYLSKSQLLESYSRSSISTSYKYIHLIIALAGILLGSLFAMVRWNLSARQLLADSNIAYMALTILSICFILMVLYIIIERTCMQDAIRQWELFEDLSAKRLPVFVPSLETGKVLSKLNSIEKLLISCNQQLGNQDNKDPRHIELEMEYLDRLSQGFISETTGTLTGYIQQLSAVLESNIKTQQLLRDSMKVLLNDLAISVKDQRTMNSELAQLVQLVREKTGND